MEEDGDRQTYTLTKHTEDTDLKMTGEDLAKLLEADYTKTENDDGSYTLTKASALLPANKLCTSP